MQQLAEDLLHTDVPQQVFLQLVTVLTKWQLLTQQIEALKQPQKTKPVLYNEVFHTMVHNRRVDLVDLRTCIERMLPLIKRKNIRFTEKRTRRTNGLNLSVTNFCAPVW